MTQPERSRFRDEQDGFLTARSTGVIPSPENPITPTAAAIIASTEPSGATELDQFPSDSRASSPASISSGSVRIVRRRTTRSTVSSAEPTGRFRKIKIFWRQNVALSVSHKQNRDHFALERTYLAWIRTSLAFAMLGVLIAQLFGLNRQIVHNPEFGFFKVGKPLACACHGIAFAVAISGAYRFWRQQSALANGRVYAGGHEVQFLAFLTAGMLVSLLILVIFISARRDREPE